MPALLLQGSIWLSLLAWAAGECLRLGAGSDWTKLAPRVRRLWSTSCAAAFVHVGLAFELRHGWSHASAVAETARQTDDLLGVRYGGGVYANYAFLGVFAADVLWWWRDDRSYLRRPRAVDLAVRLFLLFMFANGAVVFAHGPVRVVGALCLVALLLAYFRGRAYSVTSKPPSGPDRESPPTQTRNAPGSTT